MTRPVSLSLARTIATVWTLPNTFLGLGLGLFNASLPHIYGRVWEIPLRSGPVLAVCRALGISAFTLGNCVLYARQATTPLRVHEGRHVRQYQVLGPLFLPVYYLLLLVYGYEDHPLERDARNFAHKVCLELQRQHRNTA